MPSDSAIIHTRIDSKLKKSAEAVLKQLGLTSAEAIRMFFAQVSTKKGIPFNLNTSPHLDENGFTEEQIKEILKREKEMKARINTEGPFYTMEDAIAHLRSK